MASPTRNLPQSARRRPPLRSTSGKHARTARCHGPNASCGSGGTALISGAATNWPILAGRPPRKANGSIIVSTRFEAADALLNKARNAVEIIRKVNDQIWESFTSCVLADRPLICRQPYPLPKIRPPTRNRGRSRFRGCEPLVDLDAMLTLTQAAQFLDVSPQLVADWRRRGRIERHLGRFYRLGDLIEVERQTRRNTQPGAFQRRAV